MAIVAGIVQGVAPIYLLIDIQGLGKICRYLVILVIHIGTILSSVLKCRTLTRILKKERTINKQKNKKKNGTPEVGIYKLKILRKKKENTLSTKKKKERKQDFDQEKKESNQDLDQEK